MSDPTNATAEDRAARDALASRGSSFLVWHDPRGRQLLTELGFTGGRLTIGRDSAADLCLFWDEQVSRLHAGVERMGRHWLVTDEGLSRNGTFVNGERLTGRRRLSHGDVIRVGATTLEYVDPAEGPGQSTVVGETPGA